MKAVLILSCLLAVASSASAESWVAWSEVYTANDATAEIVWGPRAKPEQGFESLFSTSNSVPAVTLP